MRNRLIPLACIGLWAVGCGASQDRPRPATNPAAKDLANVEFAGGGGESDLTIPDLSSSMEETGLTDSAGDSGRGPGAGVPGYAKKMGADDPRQIVQRKTIVTASLQLVVEDFDAVHQQLKDLIKKHDAQLASDEIAGAKGSSRSAKWRVRVPVKEFEAFLADVGQIGELVKSSRNSQDVTEEYYDLEARIKQKQIEEQGLLKLQEEAAAIMNKDAKARMEDLLAVRKEWNNVRQEIERAQGRLKLLTHLTELTTVTITVIERKGYVPPTAPTFSTTISRTFDNSAGSLASFGKGLVIFVVALTPWLPVIALFVAITWFFLRRMRRWAKPGASVEA